MITLTTKSVSLDPMPIDVNPGYILNPLGSLGKKNTDTWGPNQVKGMVLCGTAQVLLFLKTTLLI